MSHNIFHLFDNQQPGSFFGPPLGEGQESFDLFGHRGGSNNPFDPAFQQPDSAFNTTFFPDFESADTTGTSGPNRPASSPDDRKVGRGGIRPAGIFEGDLESRLDRALRNAQKDKDDAANAASGELVKTATQTREDIQGQIDSLTDVFTENRIDDEEIARRGRVQADQVLGEIKQLLSAKAANSSSRGLTGGGAASASSAIVKGAGIISRAESRDRNIEFQKDFNAKLQLATEAVKSQLTEARAKLDTTLGLASAQIELGRPIDPRLILGAITDLEAINTGDEQFDEIIQLARDNAEDLAPDLLELILGGVSRDLTSRGFETQGTRVETLGQFADFVS